MRGLLAGLTLGLAAATAAGQGGSSAQGIPVQGGAFLGSHNPPPFTPSQVFTGPPPAILSRPPEPPPEPTGDPLLDATLPRPPKLWAGSFDAGLNGASGNVDLFNIRANGHVKRQTATNILTGDLLYSYNSDAGKAWLHQVLGNARDEFLFAGTPWSAFTSGLLEYDALRDYRFRVAVYAGVGYTVTDTRDLTFKVRAGVGAVREIGVNGLASRWVPEFVFGKDFRWAWNDRSSFLSVVDYYPRIDDFAQFRVRARLAYEYVLDPGTNMIVRFGVQNRYDSDPGNDRPPGRAPANIKRNDLTYFATFGVKF